MMNPSTKNNSKKITMAIVAAGRIGRMHALNILSMPDVKLKTIYDKYLNHDWLEEHQIEEVQVTDDEEKILNDPEIEAVLITSSTSSHLDWIKKLIGAGKHIFCEKPVSNQSQAIYEVSKQAEEKNLFFQVAYNRRFDPQFQQVKKTVAENGIGELYLIKIINRDPLRPPYAFIPKSGGLVFDFNSHDFDMVHYISNQKVVEAYGMGATLVDPKIKELGDLDTALITLRLESGAMVSIDTCRETNYGYDQQLEAFGSKGSVKAQNLRENTLITSTQAGISIAKPMDNFTIRYREAFFNQTRSFFTQLKNQQPPLVSSWDACRAIAVAEAVDRSIKINQPVKVEYPV